MLENIRRIGVFMIAAQTVMHFAAGRQYEKYMKIIAGVIVLLQFVSPFVSSAADMAAGWQEEMKKMMEQAGDPAMAWRPEDYHANGTETKVLRRAEEEVKDRLNEIILDRECYVADVSIQFKESGGNIGNKTENEEYGLEFEGVGIILRTRTGQENEAREQNQVDAIRIEEVIIGKEKEPGAGYEEEKQQAYDMTAEEYGCLFAQALGIAADRVEVSYDGE